MASSGPNMYLMYDGSDSISDLSAFQAHAFYTNITSLIEDAGNTNGGTISTAQSPNGRWYAKIAFEDNTKKSGFISWSNENKTDTVNAIKTDKENLPGSHSDWEDYIATI